MPFDPPPTASRKPESLSNASPIADLLVKDSDSLADAVAKLDATAAPLLLVVDSDGKLAGRIGIAEIEAALARGTGIELRVGAAMIADAGGLPADTDAAQLAKFAGNSARPLALLDGERRPAGLYTQASPRRVPIAEPQLGGNELKYVTECVETNWISSQGTFVRRFEKEFAELLGVPHALAVSNGTVALHLSLAAFGIGPGDEVIVPDLTFAATLNAVLYTGGDARAGRRGAGYVEHGSRRLGRRDHAAHQGDHARPSLRPADRDGSDPGVGAQAQAGRDRGCRRSGGSRA